VRSGTASGGRAYGVAQDILQFGFGEAVGGELAKIVFYGYGSCGFVPGEKQGICPAFINGGFVWKFPDRGIGLHVLLSLEFATDSFPDDFRHFAYHTRIPRVW
jgi:hypothetical protein